MRDPGALGRDQLAAGAEILPKRVAGLHLNTITGGMRWVALRLPGFSDLWLADRSRATLSA
jgi:hypothetical protein